MSDSPIWNNHVEVTVVKEWEYEDEEIKFRHPKEEIRYSNTEKVLIHKDLISKAKEVDGFCVLKLKDGEAITVTESYEEFARVLCHNNQES